ncbi:hypothetical protein ACP70R_003234 [Stipagrostis hirtigluma subsp. patula]
MPSTIGRLRRLQYLNFTGNSLHGSITDDLSNCSGLINIMLDKNHFTGDIPTWLGGFPNLVALILSKNNLTGTLPPSLGNLSSLEALYVQYNQLVGSIPEELGRLNNLQWFAVFANRFSGTIPGSMFNISSMVAFGVDQNDFHGTLPANWGNNQPNLEFIYLSVNHFTGPVPASLANGTMMNTLDLSLNNFTGTMPQEIGTLCPRILSFDSNQIEASRNKGWEFITLLTNCTRLRVLSFQNNILSGELPGSITNLSTGLQKLFLSHNHLDGVLPSTIGQLKMLVGWGVDGNLLSGNVPSSIGNLTQLQIITFDNNKFEGPLPMSIQNLQQLYVATLSHNAFTGPLPTQIFNLSSLSYILDLADNSFVGPFPPKVGSLTKLGYLSISRNNLSGSLPDALSNCQSLLKLYLDDNSFSGTLPSSISKMRGSVVLNLAKNVLSGAIPQEFGHMEGLEELDLSHNNFSGKMKHLIILAAIISTGSLFCFIFACLFYWRRKRGVHSTTITATALALMDDKYPKVSYADLVQGTDGFSDTNLIGRGRYGSVYKCRLSLKNVETVVAVKIFNLQQPGSSKTFVAECEALSKIRHRNLICIITCCSTTDPRQNDFKALVFEFMPNQSLDKWLHYQSPGLDVSSPIPCLTLTQRLNIAVDIAEALDYLHNNCEPPIVHCDLKPSNILLNEDFVACVGDFGLAKILSDSEGEQLINSTSFTGIRGTIGYVAPEYGDGAQVSSCGDVFRFGVLLLEMFTGKAPTDAMFVDGLTLQSYVETKFPHNLMDIVDPILLSSDDICQRMPQHRSDGGVDIDNTIKSVIGLALSCSKLTPSDRICMRDAAAEMRKIRDSYVTGKSRGNYL